MYYYKYEYKEAFKTIRWYVCIVIIGGFGSNKKNGDRAINSNSSMTWQ